ncbi:MAG: class I SAM-dependent methyltransferase [Clostridia bacterium]|nr:class I SAM-dependent methyltransferase [Clostridia bacterium]
MKDISDIYDVNFYSFCAKEYLSSSQAIAQLIIKHFNPASVIDIGCGCGLYLKALNDLGVQDIIGYDGSVHAAEKSLIPDKTKVFDLREGLKLDRKYDLCICIEVAEHIANEYSGILVETLTSLSDTIFFTAAPPGQEGLDHINLQPYSYWISLFKQQGYEKADITETIRKEMGERHVMWFLVNNIMIFKKEV